MLLTVLIALAGFQGEPAEAACQVVFEGRDPHDGGPRGAEARCPEDVVEAAALQAAADEAIGQVSFDGFSRRQ